MPQFPANIDLSSLDGTTGFKLSGAAASQMSGAVAAAGARDETRGSPPLQNDSALSTTIQFCSKDLPVALRQPRHGAIGGLRAEGIAGRPQIMSLVPQARSHPRPPER
jgi:hypothetical protein